MILFHNDYNMTCHSAVMNKLDEAAKFQNGGYGVDEHCSKAAAMIRDKCGNTKVDVHFLVGGTQSNLVVIAAALRPHQGAICAHTGHINVHETGAVEATGHKVLSVSSDDGKITAEQIVDCVTAHNDDPDAEHTVMPKLVYISNPTELGTVYTLDELENIADVCRRFGLYLFVDGARLGYGLTADGNDVTLADLARLTDAFYIGGTKCGAMFGEAVVISNPRLSEGFRYIVKQRGAMLAKGWLLGVQFEALFENDLYFEICAAANRKADKLRAAIDASGYTYLIKNTTNQVFPILPNALLDELSKSFTFVRQQKIDNEHTAVRFCTSWATTDEEVEALCNAICNTAVR